MGVVRTTLGEAILLSGGDDKIRDMRDGDWITLSAVAVAVLALAISTMLTRRSVRASERQTLIQEAIRTAAAQPYVWIDIRPNEEHGQFLTVVLGNTGPTVATDVRVTFAPPLAFEAEGSFRGPLVEQRLAQGVASLAPGRTMSWNVGLPWKIIDSGQPTRYRATIRASGPFGPVDANEYDIDLEALRYTKQAPNGTLHGVAVAIERLTKSLGPAASSHSLRPTE